MKFILNSVRRIDNDQAKEHAFGTMQSLEEKLAVAFINPNDFEKLNLVSSLHLKISIEGASVAVKVEKDEDIPDGSIVMPVSLWSNQLTVVQNNELLYKNIVVDVEATRDPITKFEDIIQKLVVNK